MSILLALPVKSLLRFQSVCWSWHDLILSRRFINIHHHRTNRSSSLICFHSDDSGRTTYNSVSVSSEDGKTIVTPLSLPPPTTLHERRRIYIADSCRGMVCFSSGLCPHSVVLWNIATHKFTTFHGIIHRVPPKNHITMRSNRLATDLATGFTFLPITNEYKLVRIILYLNHSAYIRITRWDDSMKFLPATEIDVDFPYQITQFGGRCLNANDAIHWLGRRVEGGPSIVIAFDMTEDKLREIGTPFTNGMERCKSYHRKLLLLNDDRLAIFGSLLCDENQQGYCNYSYTLWALNDYRCASECWSKQYTFETEYDLQPMGFRFNGEVVVIRMKGLPSKMCLYDRHTDQIKDLPVVIDNNMYYSSIFYYKESLVPLPPPPSNNNVCSFQYCPFQYCPPSIIHPDDEEEE